MALTGVTHAAPCARCLHTGLGAGTQEPVSHRVLRDDVLHPGDVQECQQHPQELKRRGRAGEPLPGAWRAGPRPSPKQPEPGAPSAPPQKPQKPSILGLPSTPVMPLTTGGPLASPLCLLSLFSSVKWA